jgi:hypothetical protein
MDYLNARLANADGTPPNQPSSPQFGGRGHPLTVANSQPEGIASTPASLEGERRSGLDSMQDIRISLP